MSLSDDTPPLISARDPLRALMLLTRLPVPGADGTRMAASAWAWPIVGLVVGGLGAMAALAAASLGLTPGVQAGIALAVMSVVTGGLHEDGLADCADGFWGGMTRDRRLEIMKDSRIGSYGVLSLIFGIGLIWVSLSALIAGGVVWAAILVPACLSRAAMAGVMAALPFAREDGLARHVGRPGAASAGLAVVLAGGISVTLAGWGGAVALLAVLAVSVGTARIAMAKLGGQTGDVLGATQVLSQLAALVALSALML